MIGDVVFVYHKNNIISKLMAKIMGSNWSHCAVVYAIYEDRVLLCETSDWQVNLNWYDRYELDENCSLEVLRHPLADFTKQHNKLQDNCDIILGSIYPYIQLLSLGIRCLLKRKIKNFIKWNFVCCHVVRQAFDNVPNSDISELEQKSFDTEELYQYLINNKKWIIVHKK